MLTKLLIANRGEIAVRIIRTARQLGYRTVAIYSDADANALHVELADEAVPIGPAPASKSYLNIGAVLEAARKTGADAIHPGYGFLSENAQFAAACKNDGLVFIGPPEPAIELMGSKRRSKIAMQQAGIPCVPGFEGENASDEELIVAAGTIGYPLMIKASAGGGGRGMRLVRDEKRLHDEIRRARSEARNVFGDDELILEKAVIEPRHIEIQVFADQHGNAVYLGERDCSIQRRHQKVVEEAPSPFMTPELRQAMGEAAVKAALACRYEGAGTVEFLVDQARNFDFLEMNTRLQVEHPVTEIVTGQDLVEWQLAVAEGRQLPLNQSDITLTGHAIEVRLYAEDPANGFTPQTGTLHRFAPAITDGIRVDTGVRSGDTVSPYYDPMLAKMVAYGCNRDEARRRLLRALEDTVIFGVTTNRHFLSRIIADQAFGAGAATTAFLDQAFAADSSMAPVEATMMEVALAGAILSSDFSADAHWSNSASSAVPLSLDVEGTTISVSVKRQGQSVDVLRGEDSLSFDIQSLTDSRMAFVADGVRRVCHYQRRGDHLYLQILGHSLCITDLTHQPPKTISEACSGRLLASMDGGIVDVLVKAGDSVRRGDTLVILEAMKMEHPVKADRDGQVGTVLTTSGDQVRRHQVLVELV